MVHVRGAPSLRSFLLGPSVLFLFGCLRDVAESLEPARPVLVEDVVELGHLHLVDSVEPASRRSSINLASRNTLRCWETAGRVTSWKRAAISVAGSSRAQTRRRISRLRGSARALSATSTCIL